MLGWWLVFSVASALRPHRVGVSLLPEAATAQRCLFRLRCCPLIVSDISSPTTPNSPLHLKRHLAFLMLKEYQIHSTLRSKSPHQNVQVRLGVNAMSRSSRLVQCLCFVF